MKEEEKDKTVNDNKKENNQPTLINMEEWCDQHEKILVEWADKALCYRWMHANAQLGYAMKNRWFTIPVIIMSTLTGTANFAQERIPQESQAMYSVIVGSINILAGIITTIQQFLKISELNEAYRVSSISWDKFYRNIKLELSKSREERMPAYQMIKISKEEFDRLMETSPNIDQKIINKFSTTFNKKKDLYNELHKPEICNDITSTKHFVFKETEENIKKKKNKNMLENIRNNNDYRRKTIQVNDFINTFKLEFKREPSIDELMDNLEDISNNIIENII